MFANTQRSLVNSNPAALSGILSSFFALFAGADSSKWVQVDLFGLKPLPFCFSSIVYTILQAPLPVGTPPWALWGQSKACAIGPLCSRHLLSPMNHCYCGSKQQRNKLQALNAFYQCSVGKGQPENNLPNSIQSKHLPNSMTGVGLGNVQLKRQFQPRI